ncbi:MAG: SelT/SelW/SelH family protein [Cyanobacteria bacterium REEB67]|nr:SelT/SelW/SelH family protein [Cyanobacteria bacterium REEB67]
MAAELETKLQAEVQISPSTGGVFEVEDRGVLIFSKKQLGRFPQEGEIMDLINKHGGAETSTTPDDAKEMAAAKPDQSTPFLGWLGKQFKGSRRD